MNNIILNRNTRNWLDALRKENGLCESGKRSCVECWYGGGRKAAARRDVCRNVWRLRGLKGCIGMYVYLSERFKRWNLVTIFPSCFPSHICRCFDFSSCNVTTKIDKNSVKYLQDINLSQVTVSEKTEIMNLGRGKPDLVITVITKQNTNLCWKI
jgi:hypothetical protein